MINLKYENCQIKFVQSQAYQIIKIWGMKQKQFACVKWLIIVMLLTCIHSSRDQQEDQCYYCSQFANKCQLCYLNCENFVFKTCYQGRNSYDEQTCIKNCCPSDIGATSFDYQIMKKCQYSTEQSQPWVQNVGYYSVITLGSIAIVFLIVLMIRGIYTRLKLSRHQNIRRVIPNPPINSHSSLNPHFDENTFNQSHSQLNDFQKNYPENCNQIMNDESNTCCICLQNNVNALTKCGHVFHLNCLSAWSHRKNSCPLCSYKNISKAKLFCLGCKTQVKQVDLTKITQKQLNDLHFSWCKNCQK